MARVTRAGRGAGQRLAARRAPAALVTLAALACSGCNALWGITSLDVEGDGGDLDARAPSPVRDATTDGDATLPGDASHDADAGDAGDAAPSQDGGPGADYCALADAGPDLVLCDDFDRYEGSLATLLDSGTWGSTAYITGATATLDLSTAVDAGVDRAWALHELNPVNAGVRSQAYLYQHTKANPVFIRIQLDLWVSSIPKATESDYIAFVGVSFEHGGEPPQYDLAIIIDDDGFSFGPGSAPSTTTLTPQTWTHIDWTVQPNQMEPYAVSTSLVVDGVTAIPLTDVGDVRDAGAFGAATIQVGLTYENSTPTAHDVYIDNVLVTAHP